MHRTRFDNRLIMFGGPSGAGKSMLSAYLHEQLLRRGVTSFYIPEEDGYRLEAMTPFTPQWLSCDPRGVETLLKAIHTLCMEWSLSQTTRTTDHFLPAFHWLHGKYSRERIESYADEVARILAPLCPVFVCLNVSVPAAWERAVAQRGPQWSDWMVDRFGALAFPHYPGGPLRDLGDVLAYFQWSQEQTQALLQTWPVTTLMLDTLSSSMEESQRRLFEYFIPELVPDRADVGR